MPKISKRLASLAGKIERRIPRYEKTKKDEATYENFWGAGSRPRSKRL